jgi:hypothetical protein
LGIILIGITIFTYGEVWGAECAWVLWHKIVKTTWTPQGGKIENPYWELRGAFPKYEQCMEFRKEDIKDKKEIWTKESQEVRDTIDGIGIKIGINKSLTNGVMLLFDWYCMPDTTDPRK